MTKFTLEQVRDGIKQALEQRGDGYIYQPRHGDCVYSHEGKPDCLVGQVIYNLDLDLFDQLVAEERERRMSGLGGGVVNMMATITANVPSEVVTALKVTQSAQDLGATWGVAAEKFEQMIAELS